MSIHHLNKSFRKIIKKIQVVYSLRKIEYKKVLSIPNKISTNPAWFNKSNQLKLFREDGDVIKCRTILRRVTQQR